MKLETQNVVTVWIGRQVVRNIFIRKITDQIIIYGNGTDFSVRSLKFISLHSNNSLGKEGKLYCGLY